jgi:hypothetical protein
MGITGRIPPQVDRLYGCWPGVWVTIRKTVESAGYITASDVDNLVDDGLGRISPVIHRDQSPSSFFKDSLIKIRRRV